MAAPLPPSHWSPVAFLLLAIAACGGRSSGAAGSGSSSGTSGVSAGNGSASSDAGVEAGVLVPPSCAPGGPGMTNCGATGESCCTSLEVTGGTFYRTYDLNLPNLPAYVVPQDGGPTGEADPAAVSSFRLDKYDVTVGRFRQFVAAWTTGWTPAPGSGKHTHLNGGRGLMDMSAAADAGTAYETGWIASDNGNLAPTDFNLLCQGRADFDSWTPSVGTRENRPMNCVSWFEAAAFCIWDGGFLPSEAEYEYAAAGGNQQRAYPWGSTDPGGASHYAIYGDDLGNCYYPGGALEPCTGMSVAPVGTALSGAGLFGQLDLSGNVWQWVSDWFLTNYAKCTDCASLTAPPPDFQLTAVPSRVLRGGSFSSSAQDLLAPARWAWSDPASRTLNDGFRCARSP